MRSFVVSLIVLSCAIASYPFVSSYAEVRSRYQSGNASNYDETNIYKNSDYKIQSDDRDYSDRSEDSYNEDDISPRKRNYSSKRSSPKRRSSYTEENDSIFDYPKGVYVSLGGFTSFGKYSRSTVTNQGSVTVLGAGDDTISSIFGVFADIGYRFPIAQRFFIAPELIGQFHFNKINIKASYGNVFTIDPNSFKGIVRVGGYINDRFNINAFAGANYYRVRYYPFGDSNTQAVNASTYGTYKDKIDPVFGLGLGCLLSETLELKIDASYTKIEASADKLILQNSSNQSLTSSARDAMTLTSVNIGITKYML